MKDGKITLVGRSAVTDMGTENADQDLLQKDPVVDDGQRSLSIATSGIRGATCGETIRKAMEDFRGTGNRPRTRCIPGATICHGGRTATDAHGWGSRRRVIA